MAQQPLARQQLIAQARGRGLGQTQRPGNLHQRGRFLGPAHIVQHRQRALRGGDVYFVMRCGLRGRGGSHRGGNIWFA